MKFFLQKLAPYRSLCEKVTILESQLNTVCNTNKGLADVLEAKQKELEDRPKLTWKDLTLTAVDQVSLRNLDEFQRAALFHSLEIIRLCNYEEPLRKACIQVRDFLMEQTKNEKLNLLPHEKAESFKEIQAKIGEKAKKIPALPRSDSLYA
jgi:hypothetical protein